MMYDVRCMMSGAGVSVGRLVCNPLILRVSVGSVGPFCFALNSLLFVT